ncbi:TPA: hypothetical protein N0F65_008543 [Lagenidium giganteum]|uniref:Uncharacterized protein n=1 Tax=Lagenidium giganteum TaxID=4803 RepID=A0AAV2YRI0_9STRA|nr:TPA: hypothetical protein N0F65_008543 [Lagenidium giganteum]
MCGSRGNSVLKTPVKSCLKVYQHC